MHNPGMIYGYARVSTAAQDETGQVRQLKAAGCEKVFREKITGTTADRPQLQKLMKALAPGDVVITPAVDRLSRDATDLLVIALDMQRAGAGLHSIAEPVVDTTSDFAELVPFVNDLAQRIVGPGQELHLGDELGPHPMHAAEHRGRAEAARARRLAVRERLA